MAWKGPFSICVFRAGVLKLQPRLRPWVQYRNRPSQAVSSAWILYLSRLTSMGPDVIRFPCSDVPGIASDDMRPWIGDQLIMTSYCSTCWKQGSRMLYGHFEIFVSAWSQYLSALSARLYLSPYLLLNIGRTKMTYFKNGITVHPSAWFFFCELPTVLKTTRQSSYNFILLQWTRVELVWTSGRDISIIELFSAVSNLISRGSGISLPHHQWV